MERALAEDATCSLGWGLLALNHASVMHVTVERLRNTARSLPAWLSQNHAVLLLAAVLLLLPVRMSHQAAWLILLLLGVARVFQAPRPLWLQPEVRLFGVCFGLMFMPLLLSNLAAVDPFDAARNTVRYLGFFLVGAALLLQPDSRASTRPLWWIVLLSLSVWVVDGLWQYLLGVSLFGAPLTDAEFHEGSITGVFHPDLRIGIILAHLLPLYVEALFRLAKGRWRVLWLLLPAYLVVILLSGSRMAWAVAGLAFGFYGVYRVVTSSNRPRALLLLVVSAGVGLVAVWVGTLVSPAFDLRMDRTLHLLQFDYESWDHATSLRMQVWTAATEVVREHWLLGVGARGFTETALSMGVMQQGFLHTHLTALEVAVATGLPGLIAYLLAFAVFLIWWLRLSRRYPGVFLPGLGALLMLSPLNAHWSFYSTYYTTVLWFLMFAVLLAAREARLSSQVTRAKAAGGA